MKCMKRMIPCMNLIIAMGFVFLMGCKTGRIDLIKTGEYVLDVEQDDEHHIRFITAYQEDDGFKLSGKISRRHLHGIFGVGHIDVTLVSPENVPFERFGVYYHPRKVPRRRGGTSYFSVRLPNLPPSGTVVRLEYHHLGIIPREERIE